LLLLIAAAVLFISVTSGAECSPSQEKATVRTAGEAKTFIDDLINGTKTRSQYQLANDAAPVARAAVADTGPLSLLQRLVDEAADQACDVLGITKNVAKATPESPFSVLLLTEQKNEIRDRALTEDGVPYSFTDRVLKAAGGMANSTLVESADSACYVASNT
jgi:hypothetical protein